MEKIKGGNIMIIGIIGAGGKMGGRITDNLIKTDYELLLCENGQAGRERLKEKGLDITSIEETASKSDIVILAVPDIRIFEVSKYVVPMLKKDAVLITLDPAAACANELALREDCTFVVTHPCHPALFYPQKTDEARKDFFGGIAAEQDIVISLLQGKEEMFNNAEEVCIKMFAPVVKCHRITVDQMALLEPAAAEVVIAAAATLMKEALDEVVKRGVPEAAAKSFLLGHVQIPLAIAFGAIASPFSDGAKVAISVGYDKVFKENWKEVFEPEVVKETIQKMLHPETLKK
jgi:D-apionate oxidoisomerase